MALVKSSLNFLTLFVIISKISGVSELSTETNLAYPISVLNDSDERSLVILTLLILMGASTRSDFAANRGF